MRVQNFVLIRLLYCLPMERMKIEIEKSEYDRLKSREEKLLAYYGWFVDKENDLATVEDIINENIELHNTIEDIYKENRKLLGDKVRLKTLSNHKTDVITWLWKNLDEFREENKKLNIKVASLEWEIKWLNSTIDKLREELSAYDREDFDEDKKAKNIFIDKSWKVIKGWEFKTLC